MSATPVVTVTDPSAAPAIARLAATTFPLACPTHSTPENIAAHIAAELSPERFADWIGSPHRDVMAAQTADGPLGYALVCHGPPDSADVRAAVGDQAVSEVSKMYVLPDHHGSGLAHRLMEAALDAARRHGSATAWLGVNEENLRAVTYYRKTGFEVVGRRTFDMNGAVEHDYVMARKL